MDFKLRFSLENEYLFFLMCRSMILHNVHNVPQANEKSDPWEVAMQDPRNWAHVLWER